MKAHLWFSTYTPSKLSQALYLISTDPPDSKAEEDAHSHLKKAFKDKDYDALTNTVHTLTEVTFEVLMLLPLLCCTLSDTGIPANICARKAGPPLLRSSCMWLAALPTVNLESIISLDVGSCFTNSDDGSPANS